MRISPNFGINMMNNSYSNSNNIMMNYKNINGYPNNMNNYENIGFNNFSEEKKDIKRDENLDVKMDVDNILKAGIDLNNKNIDVQHILNYIPFTIIKDTPKEIKNRPHCLICLSNFEVNEKVSAIPCCHCFHTKCLDDWIISKARESKYAKCPICNFEITLSNLIGEDIIKNYSKKIEEANSEKKEGELQEINGIEMKEQKEKELKEKEIKEQKEKELKEKEIKEQEENKIKKQKEREQKEIKDKEQKEKKVKEHKERMEKEKEQKKKESERKEKRKKGRSKKKTIKKKK